MGYKIKIRGTTHDLKDGFTIKEEFNETLDSGTVQFATYGEELNKEPFDDVTIFNDESNIIDDKHLEVDSIVDDIIAFGDPLEKSDHFYTMSLFSETKELERITMPCCSVTQPLTGTKTSVWTKISEYCTLYLPKIKVANEQYSAGWTYASIFQIDSAVKTKFENVICPEFQWDNPTLREVLNDLMSTLDCIVVVKDHVLTYYDLTARGDHIETNKLTRMTSNFSSSDYISELTMYMKNGVGKNLTSSYRFQTPKTTDESGEITTDNMAITTQKPIYSVKSLKIYFIASSHKLHCVDVTSRVLEYDNFRTKSRIYVGTIVGSKYRNLPTWTDANGCALPDHQINYLYYKRGGFSIENLGRIFQGNRSGLSFLTHSYPSQCNHLRNMDAQDIEQLGQSLIDSGRNIFYEIEYETLYEQAMHFGKNIPNNHPENRIFDNQSNAYVDIQHQSIFEYAKVNRLSNQIKEIYGEYERESEVPLLGDYIDDYILFSKETTYYDNKIMFKGFLTKNYILKDYYTGVMAKKRSWAIASQQEALTRHEIIKLYIEASFSKKKDDVSYLTSVDYTGHSRLILDLTNVKPLETDVVASKTLNKIRLYTYTQSGSIYRPSVNHAFALDSDVEILGNSICWTFGFEDNFKAMDYADVTSDLYTQNFYTYTKDDGTFVQMIVDVVYNIPDYLKDADGLSYTLPTPFEQGGDDDISYADRDALLEQFRVKPLVPRLALQSDNANGVYGFTVRKSIYKDQREIIKTTVQFEYCSDTSDIIIKPKFLEYVRAVNADTSKAVFLWVKTGGKYNESDSQASGIRASGSYINYTIDSTNHNNIMISQNAFETLTAWCIADADGNILLAVNKNSAIYFNIVQHRDDNIYFSVLDRTIVGNIKDNGASNLAENIRLHNQELSQTASNGNYSATINLEGSVGGGNTGISARGRTIDKNSTITLIEAAP